MNAVLWIGFVLISLAAGHYLFHHFREWRRRRKDKALYEATFNSPLSQLARELGKAKRTMSPEEYAEVEKTVFQYIEQHNAKIKENQ